ncbi:Glycosyl Hydrolase 5 [Hyalella azteca]|uniref:Glycosyl Hydrolase 5 n=1 Tax=Hyalella azteca TaxID=294128 RepID=A0A6A0HB55_HYAAZ|nr:Glycosyl Hydrolase 5 [Hyalella azteca]
MKAFLIIAACLAASASAVKLTVSGSSLMYGGEKVYLSGANAAWNSYGYDFGNGGYDGSLETWLAEVKAAGGNSFRIWVHVEGYSTPNFDSDGYVTACDRTGDFINDVKKFLDAAQANDILVTLTLWNGAVMGNQAYINLPLASALSGHPALAAYEAINEPEGSVRVESNSNSCYDTTVIGQSGAGWTGVGIPMERFLTFIGKQNIVIKQNDPSALVTLGSWGEFKLYAVYENINEIRNKEVSASDYKLDRPIVIGEFASVCSLNTPLSDLHNYAYSHGYAVSYICIIMI